MICSMRRGETIACSAGYAAYDGRAGVRVAAGAQAVHRGFYYAGAGKIGKANGKRQEKDQHGPLFPVSPQAKTNDENI